MPRYRFTKAQRLRSSAEFAHVFDRKLRAGDDVLLMFAAVNEIGVTRLGLSVSRKQGNAVVRSSRKRLLREAFRLEQHELPPGLDLVLIPRAGVAATLEQYRRSIVRLSHKLARKMESTIAPPSSPPNNAISVSADQEPSS